MSPPGCRIISRGSMPQIPGDEAARDPGDVEKTWYHPQRWIRNWPQSCQLHFPKTECRDLIGSDEPMAKPDDANHVRRRARRLVIRTMRSGLAFEATNQKLPQASGLARPRACKQEHLQRPLRDQKIRTSNRNLRSSMDRARLLRERQDDYEA